MAERNKKKFYIPLPEQGAIDLLLKVKPTDEMPSRKKRAKKKAESEPLRKRKESS